MQTISGIKLKLDLLGHGGVVWNDFALAYVGKGNTDLVKFYTLSDNKVHLEELNFTGQTILITKHFVIMNHYNYQSEPIRTTVYSYNKKTGKLHTYSQWLTTSMGTDRHGRLLKINDANYSGIMDDVINETIENKDWEINEQPLLRSNVFNGLTELLAKRLITDSPVIINRADKYHISESQRPELILATGEVIELSKYITPDDFENLQVLKQGNHYIVASAEFVQHNGDKWEVRHKQRGLGPMYLPEDITKTVCIIDDTGRVLSWGQGISGEVR